jgi:S1-C subfamily serine protease
MTRLTVAIFLLFAPACAVRQASRENAPATTATQPSSAAAPVTLSASDVAPPSRKTVIRQVLPSNVRLLLRDGKEDAKTASGVVLGAEDSALGVASFVITNAHALDTAGLKEPKLFVLIEHQGEAVEYEAEPVAIGKVPEMDLALIKVPGARLQAATLASDEELEAGEDVVVAAAPFGRAISVTGGMVSHVEWDRKLRQPSMLKTDAAIGYGASGGGVFSLSTGNLLAIVEGYRTAKVGFNVAQERYSFDVPMPGETFAAPSSKVRAFLAEKGFSRLLSEGDAPRQAAR